MSPPSAAGAHFRLRWLLLLLTAIHVTCIHDHKLDQRQWWLIDTGWCCDCCGCWKCPYTMPGPIYPTYPTGPTIPSNPTHSAYPPYSTYPTYPTYYPTYPTYSTYPPYPTYSPQTTFVPPRQSICRYGEPQKNENGQTVMCNFDVRLCAAGYWCHRGATVQTTVCCPKQNAWDKPCDLGMNEGEGNDALLRWFYDSQSGTCLSFTYRGRWGNANNFMSKDECQRTCISQLYQVCSTGPPQIGLNNQPVYCSPSDSSACNSQSWCHIGGSAETTLCCTGAVSNFCQLPMVTGIGNQNLLRWYYDTAAHSCRTFMYRGFGGNQNSFLSKSDCEGQCSASNNPCPVGEPLVSPQGSWYTCRFETGCGSGYWCHYGPTTSSTVCCIGDLKLACAGLPPSSGVGTYSLVRWYYDATSQQCKSFDYKGSKGNQNNFLSPSDCESACKAPAPTPTPRINPCTVPVTTFTPCSPVTQGQCPSGEWCHYGATDLTTVCCPGAVANPCILPLNQGFGNFSLPRYYYNSQSQQCEPFSYAGLLGNQNNFLTQAACEARCRSYTDPCVTGPVVLGPDGQPRQCSAHMQTSACPSGSWCHVGASASTTVCCPGSQDPCQLPMSVGIGNDNLLRWRYDNLTGTCVEFYYHGLKGNQNNFVSKDACKLACRQFRNPCVGAPAKDVNGRVVFCSATNVDNCPVNFWCHLGAGPETTVCCPGATNPCSVPLVPGTGTSRLSRWYYNANERVCMPFDYNGLYGNQNNFLTEKACSAVCPDKVSNLT